MADLQPARARAAVPADPRAPERAAGRGRRARQRMPRVVALVDRDRTGRGRAADPRRRPADPDPQAARRDGLQHDVGAHRLHEANGATRLVPGSHTADHSPDVRAAYDTIAARRWQRAACSSGTASLWHGGGANTHRPAPRRHRDELLRGLDPPAGEPAARHPARGRGALLASAARALSATASTAGSSATSTSTTRPSCSTRPAPRLRWCGIGYERPRGAFGACASAR